MGGGQGFQGLRRPGVLSPHAPIATTAVRINMGVLLKTSRFLALNDLVIGFSEIKKVKVPIADVRWTLSLRSLSGRGVPVPIRVCLPLRWLRQRVVQRRRLCQTPAVSFMELSSPGANVPQVGLGQG